MRFEDCRRTDVALVGGKNASLGEMVHSLTSQGINVPGGFASTSAAYWRFIKENDLESFIRESIDSLNQGKATLAETGAAIRRAILKGSWPEDVANAIAEEYRHLEAVTGRPGLDVAVRSSATAEDLPDASFAGQQESYLNICGTEALLRTCQRCYSSLFTDRAISYRSVKGFDHFKVALSIGVQIMVRADRGGSGVMFSIDTESGFDKAVVINAAWGLGENVVQGAVDPDEFVVFKPFLTDASLTPIIEKRLGAKAQKMIYAEGESPTVNVPTSRLEQRSFVLDDQEVLTLARWAAIIESHYGCPMDMEWARDGLDGSLAIVQARPETVQSRRDASVFKSYRITGDSEVLVTGLSIGESVVSAPVCMIDNPSEIENFKDGSILVTGNTDPDWVPIMKRAAGIVTDHGGRTSHAAIVSREMGLPAIVGALDATDKLHDGQIVTLSCARGDEGAIYDGAVAFEVEDILLDHIPDTKTKVMLNLANPGAAFRWWRMPVDGVGLARMEFVISNHIRIHPMALVRYDTLQDQAAKSQIDELTRGYEDKCDYFVDKLSRGLARIAAVVHPSPVIIRMSDFKTNEYANLIGGQVFETPEANPMIGFRGASRYYSDAYAEGFALECKAIVKLRQSMGFKNVIVMIPFCRTTREADKVLEVMANQGLKRGEDGLQVYVMCEIPSNVIMASRFADKFDGFSIGSNDLTQLTLGVDRDSELLADLFDEQDDAVEWMISKVIQEAARAGAKVGICGQAPSDHPEFARFLVEAGIDSISVTPDSFVEVKKHVAAAEKSKLPAAEPVMS
ncbi:MAG: phosphoenolpyruvate synthase [Granulosicoccus sp.]|nr:phosphoenolpyruvate synthase [Granulosicoccus sp.]